MIRGVIPFFVRKGWLGEEGGGRESYQYDQRDQRKMLVLMLHDILMRYFLVHVNSLPTIVHYFSYV